MKLTNDKIAAMVSSVLRGGKPYRSHDLIHPEREWFIGVLCFVVLALGAGWWAASLYMRFIDPARLLPEEVASETVMFRPAQVEAALAALDEREKRYLAAEAALRGGERIVPSVEEPEDTDVATSSEAVVEPLSAETETETEAPASTVDSSESIEVAPSDEASAEEPTMAF